MGLLMQEIIRAINEHRHTGGLGGKLRMSMHPETLAEVQREIEAGGMGIAHDDQPPLVIPPEEEGFVMWLLGVPVYQTRAATVGKVMMTEMP